MASLCSNLMVVMVLAAAAAMVLTVSGDTCPTGKLVYPYWSTCLNPALYDGLEVYELIAPVGSAGSLAPEWDETNSTYYLRLSDEGAKYKLMSTSTVLWSTYVTQTDAVTFVNVDTSRALAWRQEGEDEMFLVESSDDSASFQFTVAEDVALPCPTIYTAQCEAYYIVDSGNSSRGLSPYEEDGVTYFKLGSDNLLPFVLSRSSYDYRSSVLASPA